VSLLAPALIFLGTHRSRLSPRVLIGALVLVSLLLLLRADIAFFVRDGWPTGDTLLRVKNLYRPHDFHYYGLQNPIPTAMFVVMLLTLAVVWLTGERARGVRWLLMVAAAVSMLTLYLLYIRIGLALGLILFVYGLTRLRPSRWVLLGLIGLVAVGLAFLVATGPSVHTAVTLLNVSGEVRLHSLSAGLRTLVHHPLTGLGFGWAEQNPTRAPAHSSIVQAGMEMGLFGFVGVLLLTFSVLRLSWQARDRRSTLCTAALGAASVYVLYAAVAGGVDAGLSTGLVPIWALTVAALLGVVVTHVDPGSGTSGAGLRERSARTCSPSTAT
jgi:O-antigen ligase